jgi:hypothetical protein
LSTASVASRLVILPSKSPCTSVAVKHVEPESSRRHATD